MVRIDRATAIIECGGDAAVNELDAAIPQPTNSPQPSTDVLEFAAVVNLGDGRTLKAYYYQQAAALQQVDNDPTLLHWDARDYEVVS